VDGLGKYVTSLSFFSFFFLFFVIKGRMHERYVKLQVPFISISRLAVETILGLIKLIFWHENSADKMHVQSRPTDGTVT